jgi:type II secretory pathway component GspD/PulD (secretin)
MKFKVEADLSETERNSPKMMKRYCLILLVSIISSWDCSATNTNLYLRTFEYGSMRGCENTSSTNLDIKSFMSSMLPLTWPSGSEAYMQSLGSLVVRNTLENLDLIEELFTSEDPINQVLIELTIYAFKKELIDELVAKGAVNQDSLMTLINAGKGKLKSIASAVTKSGQEVIVKDVIEVMYPDASSQIILTSASPDAKGQTQTGFAMMEVGTTMQVVPEIWRRSSNQLETINLVIKSECSTLLKWEKHERVAVSGLALQAITVRLPVLNKTSVETSVMVQPGVGILLSGASKNDDDFVFFRFVKADIINHCKNSKLPQ